MSTLNNAGQFLFIVLEVVVIFNLLIIVHELGHFLAAKWRGLVIERFGVWFGKPIFEKTVNGIPFSLGWIPAGGFVALPQMAPMDIIEGTTESDRERLPQASVLDRIIVAVAGPLFSLGLAFVFAVIVWKVGRPVNEAEASVTIGYVMAGSPAAEAGLAAGDVILEVDGRPVTRFGGMGEDSIMWRIFRSEGETIPIKVQRGNEVLTVNPKPLKPEGSFWRRKSMRQIMILPAETPMVAKVEPGSRAEQAGLKPNDLITTVNGEKVLSMLQLDRAAESDPDGTLTLSVRQPGGAERQVELDHRGALVGEVMPDSPAQQAGLQKNDLILEIDDRPVKSASGVGEYIQGRGSEAVKFRGLRKGQPFETTITPAIPEQGSKKPMIGVNWGQQSGITWDEMGQFKLVHPGPTEQIRAGVMMIVNTLDAVFSKKSDIKLQHMNGPVAIMRAYYAMFESKEGWRLALWFSVVFNVNLAILNMLPIPVLDGGHIMLALVEAARRKPVNIRVLEAVQTGCAAVIILFMVYIAFFDVQDLFGGGHGVKFSPHHSSAAEK